MRRRLLFPRARRHRRRPTAFFQSTIPQKIRVKRRRFFVKQRKRLKTARNKTH